MDERLESWIAAERLIARYGPTAVQVASRRTESLREQGQQGIAETWALVESLIRQLQTAHSPVPAPR